MGKNFRYIPAHAIHNSLHSHKSLALPMFHALTGCDTVPSFLGNGMKGAWGGWRVCPTLTDALLNLPNAAKSVSDDLLVEIERCNIVMCSRTCLWGDINEVRRYLFSSGTKLHSKIPQTQDAMIQQYPSPQY